jgi:mannose-6-phosphate isomerase-like protein (cupin superfamily)
MQVEFEKMEFKSLKNFKGGEGELRAQMHVDELNKIMHGILSPGSSIGEHVHEDSSEIIYIMSGRGSVIDDGERKPLEAGMCHYCPKGHSHSVINDSDGDLEVFAVVPNQ